MPNGGLGRHRVSIDSPQSGASVMRLSLISSRLSRWFVLRIAVALFGSVTAVHILAAPDMTNPSPGTADPFSWLEDSKSERVLEWVRAQNDRSLDRKSVV